MHILKLSIGNAVLQQRHMPYIAVGAGFSHTMQFHLPRTVATVLTQGLGYGFNLKIRVFMHWNEIQGRLVLDFSANDSHFLCLSFVLPIHCRLTPQADTNTIRIICAFRILNSLVHTCLVSIGS